MASRSPESEFETGYVPQNGILNYSLVRKREKLREMPCLGEGRGHRVRQRQRGREGERGGRNGLQDKPTFLKTPGVVTTGAKQLKPSHCGYLAHEIRVSTTLLKSMTMINMILSIGR